MTEVQEGTTVQPLATNAGATAGPGRSYVLEIRRPGHPRRRPRRSPTRSPPSWSRRARPATPRTRSARSRPAGPARGREQGRRHGTTALATYQTENGISAADGKLALSAETLRVAALRPAQGPGGGGRPAGPARLDRLVARRRSRAAPSRARRIITGRSTTQLEQQQRQHRLQRPAHPAAHDPGEPRRPGGPACASCARRSTGRPRCPTTPTLAGMTGLESQLELAQKNQADLAASVQQARTTQAQGPVGLTRIDTAAEPPYPSEPKRYIYLALGLLLGALAGAGLTMWASGTTPSRPERRRGATTDRPPRAEGRDPDLLDERRSGHHVDAGAPRRSEPDPGRRHGADEPSRNGHGRDQHLRRRDAVTATRPPAPSGRAPSPSALPRSWGARSCTWLLNAVSTLAVLRYLAPDAYGTYVLILTITTLVGVVADFGLPKLAVREMLRPGQVVGRRTRSSAPSSSCGWGWPASGSWACRRCCCSSSSRRRAHLAAAVASLGMIVEAVLGIVVTIFQHPVRAAVRSRHPGRRRGHRDGSGARAHRPRRQPAVALRAAARRAARRHGPGRPPRLAALRACARDSRPRSCAGSCVRPCRWGPP